MPINENTLEQVLLSELQEKGYEYLYGPDIDRDYHEVILKDYFDSAMFKINPKITTDIVEEAYKTIKNLGLLKLEDMNAAFHKYLIEGVPVSYRANGEQSTFTVHLIDFEIPQSNDFKVINQYTIIEYKNKRPDILIFINGIPMVLFELKNMVNADTTVEDAYKQIKNYQLDIPTFFNRLPFLTGCWGGLTFELPKKWLKVTPPRVLSPAQRAVLDRMNQNKQKTPDS